MSKFLDKILSFLGFELEENELEQEDGLDKWVDPKKSGGQKGNVISLHNRPVKLVLVKPVSFDQAQDIADHLKNRRPVILNLEETEHEEARRLLDFISGTAYALNGSIQKVSAGIFLVVPVNVELAGETEPIYLRDVLRWPSSGMR